MPAEPLEDARFICHGRRKKGSLDIVKRILEAIGFQQLSLASLGHRSIGRRQFSGFFRRRPKNLCRPVSPHGILRSFDDKNIHKWL
jgi:hypothetical protein